MSGADMNAETSTVTISRLRAAMDTATRDRHLDPAIVDAALSTPPPRRRTPWLIAACVAFVAALAVGLSVARLGRDSAPSAAGCSVEQGSLPVWARAGFDPPDTHIPHVASADGSLVAVLFVPLEVHPPKGQFNKVLWVAKDPGGPLVVHASLGERQVTRTLESTGPSYLNLPAAGCWHLDLSWPGNRTTLDLAYRP